MGRRRRARDPDVCGVLLLDKPAGPTSHDVVAWVRWALGVRRVGHCGTLDPAATGVLVIGVGPATKLAPYLTGLDKGYHATIMLGRSTTTADGAGETVATAECPVGLQERVPDVLRSMVGEHQWPPPAFSAVHVDGKRAHELARAGQEVELPLRPMTVHAIDDIRARRVAPTPGEAPSAVQIEANVLVSKGTYIRTLAEQLGARVGVPAHLAALRRTRSGAATLDNPACVRGLQTEPAPPGRDGHARVRVVAPSGPDTPRSEVEALLHRHLLEPAQVVPMPVLRVMPNESGARAMLRLSSGQPVALDDAGLGPDAQARARARARANNSDPSHAVAAPEGQLVAVAASTPGVAGLVVSRVCGDPSRPSLQPERVIVPPLKHP